MKPGYHVQVVGFREVHVLPEGWTNAQYSELLQALDYDDVQSIPENELSEMAAMALSDLEPEEAAERVLALRLGDRLNAGQRRNIAEEMKDERLWESYADISFHRELFNVAGMLYWTFPRLFTEPDAVEVRLKIKALDNAPIGQLVAPSASFLCRLLNDGMNESNTIYRLFDDQISSDQFPDAEHILWEIVHNGFDTEQRMAELTIFTSIHWIDELKGVREYMSNAYADRTLP